MAGVEPVNGSMAGYDAVTFAGLGLPRIVRQALDTQHVKDLGDGTSLVSFEVRMDLVGPFALLSPLLRRRMARTFSGVLEDLQLHVEAQTSDTH